MRRFEEIYKEITEILKEIQERTAVFNLNIWYGIDKYGRDIPRVRFYADSIRFPDTKSICGEVLFLESRKRDLIDAMEDILEQLKRFVETRKPEEERKEEFEENKFFWGGDDLARRP